ncbi:MAG: PDZ domain-containing protein [Gemmatimonadota bacterium]|nr:PDZ domain-containing protein [Gemmatimonadota bacterium]
MKRLLLGVLALVVATSAASAQEMTDKERRELEQKLEHLRQEMRELERKLGRDRIRMFVQPEGPMAFAFSTDRPRLGVVVQTERNAATDSIGAVLQAVTPETPAAEAGLQAGDIIVRLNQQSLAQREARGTSPGDRLIELARDLKEGDTVRVQYRRGADTRTAVVVPRKLDDFAYAYRFERADSALAGVRELTDRMRVLETPRLRLEAEPLLFGMRDRWADMELTTLDASLGSYFGTTEGLLVVRAPKDSLLGLKSGDVLMRIGGRVPSSPSHAARILRSYEPGDEIRLEVMRNKRRTDLRATVPARERGLHWEERN